MVCSLFVIPVLLLLIGSFLYNNPPSEPNIFVGYRTKKSMRNKKTWIRANKYCGKLFLKASLFMILFSCLNIVLELFNLIVISENFVTMILLFEVCIIVIIGMVVERSI